MVQDSECDDFSHSNYEEMDIENNESNSSVCCLIEVDYSRIETFCTLGSRKSYSRGLQIGILTHVDLVHPPRASTSFTLRQHTCQIPIATSNFDNQYHPPMEPPEL
ncbi:hypothetical protein TNCV_74101 [Trichonephila clavipes]|nr:hypothetical protein TNCV_74101 [Trichonephila clavipes]